MRADSKMSYGMLFIVGLLTSVHCIVMCGGINLSQCMELRAYHSIHVKYAIHRQGRILRNRTEDWYARIVEMYSR